MSDAIKHECGIAVVRLLKPLSYYQKKYGTWAYGLNKLYLMMEKQHNRGQDGAGVVSVKLDQKPGAPYLFRERSIKKNPIQHIFKNIGLDQSSILGKQDPSLLKDSEWAKEHLPFAGEVYMGHLRYGTFGKNNIEFCHPVVRKNNWKSRNLALAGNFNMTNVDEIFTQLVNLGQHPENYTDTVTVLENVGHFLDRENQRQFDKFKARGLSNYDISKKIEINVDLEEVLRASSKRWDGGYAMSGIVGHGDMFTMRDPWGIRPAYYYYDDEIVVVASERPVIQTALNCSVDDVKELQPGQAIIAKKDGEVFLTQVREPGEKLSCSFERIYFSRGSDTDIYKERKKLGELLVPQVTEAINCEISDAVYSFIPNTAETAFLGMQSGMEDYLCDWKVEAIRKLKDHATDEQMKEIVLKTLRFEKIAIKDVKMRTFITDDESRDDMVAHVYDVTYGVVKPTDNLVVIDDSIVRGTTLKQSILRILDRLEPKRIVIVSSAPQIRYPDCYGIDMAKLGDFCAFAAAIELLKDNDMQNVIDEVYAKCKAQVGLPKEEIVNFVKEIYAPFTDDQVSAKIAEMLTPENIGSEVKIVYQTVENLHKACPKDKGDWYFTGNYPTPGGNKVVNTAFINYVEGRNQRAY